MLQKHFKKQVNNVQVTDNTAALSLGFILNLISLIQKAQPWASKAVISSLSKDLEVKKQHTTETINYGFFAWFAIQKLFKIERYQICPIIIFLKVTNFIPADLFFFQSYTVCWKSFMFDMKDSHGIPGKFTFKICTLSILIHIIILTKLIKFIWTVLTRSGYFHLCLLCWVMSLHSTNKHGLKLSFLSVNFPFTWWIFPFCLPSSFYLLEVLQVVSMFELHISSLIIL